MQLSYVLHWAPDHGITTHFSESYQISELGGFAIIRELENNGDTVVGEFHQWFSLSSSGREPLEHSSNTLKK